MFKGKTAREAGSVLAVVLGIALIGLMLPITAAFAASDAGADSSRAARDTSADASTQEGPSPSPQQGSANQGAGSADDGKSDATPASDTTSTTTPTTAAPTSANTVSRAGALVNVSTAAQLTSALAQAQPGDVITMADGSYVGKFVTSNAGTASAPITLTGSRNAILNTGSTHGAYGLHVIGEYWNLIGFTVTTAHKGIVLDQASNSIVDGVEVENIGQEGIHVRHNSAHVIVRNTFVHDTGQVSQGFGEGIYLGSSHNNWATVMGSSTTPDQSDYAIVQNNTVSNTAAEGIDVKEGTVGGQLLGNTFYNDAWSGQNSADSWVDVKGNNYVVSGNSGSKTINDGFQVHNLMPGWGQGNTFSNNSSTGDVPGYLVRIGWGATGNVVKCQTSTAARGLSNIACS